jgi:hypothetical protein
MTLAQPGAPTTLLLEQPAHVNGPVWIALRLPEYGDVRYPVGIARPISDVITWKYGATEQCFHGFRSVPPKAPVAASVAA